MGSLEHLREVDVEVDRGHGVLRAFELVGHDYGIGDSLDPDLLDVEGIVRPLSLHVLHGLHPHGA